MMLSARMAETSGLETGLREDRMRILAQWNRTLASTTSPSVNGRTDPRI